MNPMVNMPASSPSPVQRADKTTVNASQSSAKDKNMAANTKDAKGPQKDFDDVLTEAAGTTEKVETGEAEQKSDPLQAMGSAVILNLVQQPVVQQPEIQQPEVILNQSQIVTQEPEVPNPVLNTVKPQAQLADALQELIKPQQMEEVTNTAAVKPLSAQELLKGAAVRTAVTQTVAASGQEKPAPQNVAEQAVTTSHVHTAPKVQETSQEVKPTAMWNRASLIDQVQPEKQASSGKQEHGGHEEKRQPVLQNPNILSLKAQNSEKVNVFMTETPTVEVQPTVTASPFTGLTQQARAENLAPVQQPQPAQQSASPSDIRTQIVDQARLIKTAEDTQMVIKLKPEHLGELTLKVTVERGVVSASFHSENAQVRAMLESSLVQLKQDLQNQGIKVDNVSVYAGLGDSLPQGQSGQQAGQQSSRFRNRKVDLADFEERAEQVSTSMENAVDDGVDYRI